MKESTRVEDVCVTGVVSHQVCVRMKQYKDELLSSCLTFVLSLHHSIVALDIKAYCPALEVSEGPNLNLFPL